MEQKISELSDEERVFYESTKKLGYGVRDLCNGHPNGVIIASLVAVLRECVRGEKPEIMAMMNEKIIRGLLMEMDGADE